MKPIVLFIILIVISGCASQEMRRVRRMDIQDVPLSNIQDGDYIGTFAYGGFEYRVKTMIRSRKITNVQILQNRDTKHAKRAEGVVSSIIARQSPNVDAVSGATTTSKALMKAVEVSLRPH